MQVVMIVECLEHSCTAPLFLGGIDHATASLQIGMMLRLFNPNERAELASWHLLRKTFLRRMSLSCQKWVFPLHLPLKLWALHICSSSKAKRLNMMKLMSM